jgi:RNA polymerase sigma factor (sigma-70 family)
VRPRLHRYAVRRLGDSHEAEELVQEALLRAYTHRDQLLTEEDLSAWTTVVTGRLVIDRLRVRGRSTTVADVPEGSRVGRDTADVVVARDEARTALDALDAMPARQAALLWAREVEGRSYEDLCDRFTMTEPAVRSVLTRARKALRKEYALRGGTLPVGGLAVLAPWIAGLSLADKLRRVAARVTAPAALGAVGITALGGLMLSPFGGGSQDGASTYRPSQAVVTTVSSSSTATTQAVAPAAPVPAQKISLKAPVVAQPTVIGPPTALSPVNNVCGAYVGGTGCESTKTDTTYLDVMLPENALGVSYLAAQQNLVPCTSVPLNPLLACRPANPSSKPPANGAQR